MAGEYEDAMDDLDEDPMWRRMLEAVPNFTVASNVHPHRGEG